MNAKLALAAIRIYAFRALGDTGVPMRLAAALLALFVAAPAFAQQAPQRAPGEMRLRDFAGFWSNTRGGPAGVEIRLTPEYVVARELVRNTRAGDCGSEGRARLHGRELDMYFRQVCSRDPVVRESRCTVRLISRDEISTRCRNGHSARLYRARS